MLSFLKKVSVVGLTVLALGLTAGPLTGCDKLPLPWTQEQIDSKVIAVQELVKEGCNFLPTAQSIALMLAAADPTVTGVFAVAAAICNEVNKSVMADKAAPKADDNCPYGKVNGVCIEGKRL
jgi:hypothetical protein